MKVASSHSPLGMSTQPIELLQKEIDSLHDEVDALRRRDEMLKFYMTRVDEEMRLAQRLQQDFLPKRLPQIGAVHFHTLFRPAAYVSGDLYDVMRLDETHVGFYIADAVGHGMPAALLTMFMKNALLTKQIIPGAGYILVPPGQTMARLNESLVSQNLSYATFATAIYGVIDCSTLQVTFARGGHPNPIVLRGDGGMHCLQADGSLLGIFEEERYPETTVQLAPGDRMLVFTDGIEVAFSEESTVDTARWRDELWQRRELSAAQLIQHFADHIDREAGSLTPKDDLTMIAIEIKADQPTDPSHPSTPAATSSQCA
jgi:sigma-B regulation protein RsbU (phosphoserine phosphatase)